nr:MAG TPA: hypothetical protein [Caudoviricetes sp.]
MIFDLTCEFSCEMVLENGYFFAETDPYKAAAPAAILALISSCRSRKSSTYT